MWTRIQSQDGLDYQLTDEDILWAARMVEREGGLDEAPHVLWTMAQLMAPSAQREKYGRVVFSTYRGLIRAYSQPINPLWYRDGACCRPGGTTGCPSGSGASWYGEAADRPRGRCSSSGHCPCSEDKLRARDALARTPLDALSPAKVALVQAWARGEVPNPVPGAVEFASDAWGGSAGFPRRWPGGVVVARLGNYYGATAVSRAWPPDFVSMGPGRPGRLLGGLAALVAGLAVGVGAVWLGRELGR